MSHSVQEIYHQCVTVLSLEERLQLATLILNNLVEKNISFSVNIPNQTTEEAMAESKNLENLDKFTNVDDFYNDLGI